MTIQPTTNPPRIATGFVRKLYRILEHESAAVISWDAAGEAFSIHNQEDFEQDVLPRYFRCRLVMFQQQLTEHGFQRVVMGSKLKDAGDATNGLVEAATYRHESFQRGHPHKLSSIIRVRMPQRQRIRGRKAATTKKKPGGKRSTQVTVGRSTTATTKSEASGATGSSLSSRSTGVPCASTLSATLDTTTRPLLSIRQRVSAMSGTESSLPRAPPRAPPRPKEQPCQHELLLRMLKDAAPVDTSSLSETNSLPPTQRQVTQVTNPLSDIPDRWPSKTHTETVVRKQESTYSEDGDNDHAGIPAVESIARLVMIPWEMADSPAWDLCQRPREAFKTSGPPICDTQIAPDVLGTMLDCFGKSTGKTK